MRNPESREKSSGYQDPLRFSSAVLRELGGYKNSAAEISPAKETIECSAVARDGLSRLQTGDRYTGTLIAQREMNLLVFARWRNISAMPHFNLSRRSFLAMSAVLPWSVRGVAAGLTAKSIPVGLELYSVRDELKKDPEGTVRAVAKMGYQCVEFYGPYFEWTEAQAKQMRKVLDELGIRCHSTHNDEDNFSDTKIDHARELNLIIGSKYMVQAWSDPKPNLDGWKALADRLNSAAEKLSSAGLKVGYHNHDSEWKPIDGKRPIEVIASNTAPSIMLQLDVGTCLEAGADPVSWIQANPGRIRSIHCKDWSADPNVGYKTLFGEGKGDWKAIFRAAESTGGVEYYLVEQEGSRYPELETAKRCLEAFRSTYGGH